MAIKKEVHHELQQHQKDSEDFQKESHCQERKILQLIQRISRFSHHERFRS